jgi:ubiquinone/menaquinone biosynthesis C-methylase UbiE
MNDKSIPLPYVPEFTLEAERENHIIFCERNERFRKAGLDHSAHRTAILEAAGELEPDILEIGTGSGHTAIAMAMAGHTFITLDKDPVYLRIAAMNLAHEKLLSHATFFEMEAAHLAFPQSQFHTVICINFFHHAADFRPILSEIHRVLAPEGKFIAADFTQEGLDLLARFHQEESRVHENHGIRKGEIQGFFDQLGYSIQVRDESLTWILICRKPAQQVPR